MNNLPYIKSSKESILQYALGLKQKTFKNVLLKDPNITDEDRALLFEYYVKRDTFQKQAQVVPFNMNSK